MSSRGRIVSFRVSDEQYAELEAAAEGKPPGVYVKDKLFGPAATPANVRTLYSRMETVEEALKLAGLDDHINQAQDILRGRKSKEG